MTKKVKLDSRSTFLMGVGMTIGAGVITMTGLAIAYTGSGVFLAYLLAALIYFIGSFPLLIIGTTLPRTSASYSYANLISPKAGAMFVWVFFIGRVTLAFLGAAFATYLCSIVKINPTVAGVGILTVFYLINLFGLQNASKFQNIFTTILIITLLSFVIFGLPKVNYTQIFDASNILLKGPSGMLNAISLVIFGVGGGFSLLEYGGQIENPQKKLPKIIFAVTLVAGLLFASVGLVASGVLPIEKVAGKPLTYAAQVIYPVKGLFLFFMIGGALMAIMTTINGSYVWYYNATLQGCDDGWFPKIFAKRNRYGVPFVLLTIFWIIGIVPILFHINISTLARLSAGLTLAASIIPNFAVLKLPKNYPNEWETSRFHMSTPKLVTLVLCCNALLIFFIVINMIAFPLPILIAVFGIIAAVLLFVFLFGDKVISKKEMKQSF